MKKKRLIIIFLTILVIGIGSLITINYIKKDNTINEEALVTLTKEQIEQKLSILESSVYPDGTYNLDTLELVSYESGYQVSFYQVKDNYTEKEYNDIIIMFQEYSSDNIISAGKYDGETEVSFNIEDYDTALMLAQEFNQISIWDWNTSSLIETGGTGSR